MEADPSIPLGRVAAFIRQHTHDLRNSLNSLDLEAAVLREIVMEPEGREGVERIHQQVRSLAEQLRALSSTFQEPRPFAAPIAARELLLIWREKHASLKEALEVRWVDELGDEQVSADVEMIAAVFLKLLVNAARFAQGGTVTASARAQDGRVVFELVEPNKAKLDTSAWGEPFSTTRRGGYGLGLWAAQRMVAANGATLARRYDPEEAKLITQLVLTAL